MGGGDEYWRPASQSQSFSSSSSPLSQSQSQSQSSSQPSRSSVDLTELDRLRVLVKYEFATALTTNELVEALGACHNNTREAYHYLKSKRQQEQRQAHERYATYMMHGSAVNASAASSAKRRQDDDDVEIIENPSKRLREGTPSPSSPSTAAAAAQATARTLRLHSSQDVDMSSQSQSSQRQQQPYQMTGSSITTPPNTQQQEESEVEIIFSQRSVTPPTSQQQQQPAGEQENEEDTVDMEMAAARAKAQQLLTSAIEDRRQNRIASDASWVSSVLDLLRVSSNLEIAQQLDLTCDAMAAWLKEFEEHEVAANKRVGLELIFEVLSKLPRSDNVGDLSQHLRSVTQLSQEANDAEIVTLVNQLQNQEVHQTAHARSITAENVITRVTEECSSCLERIAWFKNAQKENVDYQSGVREQIQELHSRLTEMVEQCGTEVHAGDCAVDDARELKEMRSLQLHGFVIKRRNELRASGESEASAELQAHYDVFNSDDMEVVTLLQSRAESGTKIQQCVRGMQKGKKKYTFYQSATNLFNKVRKCREWSLQNALKSFEDARFASDQRSTAALMRFIPILTNALHQYYEFHIIKQARAKEQATEKEKALEVHLDYFGDSAPIGKEEIEKGIREFVGMISQSMQSMLQIADSQSRLWEGKKDMLPREVCRVLVFEYGKLWKQLSGPVRDVMQSFVSKIQVDGSGGVQVGKQTAQPVVNGSTLPPPPAVVHGSPPRAASVRNSLSPGAVGLSGVSNSSTPSMHSSPMRVEHVSVSMTMTQEVDAFLRHVEPTVMEMATPVTSPPKAPPISQVAPPTAPAAPVASTVSSVHEYPVGTVLYTKFDVGKNVAQFSRGRVDKLLEDGTYSVVYDDGDMFTVPREFLFTEEQVRIMMCQSPNNSVECMRMADWLLFVCERIQMQRDLEMRERNCDKDEAMADANATDASSDGNCAIM